MKQIIISLSFLACFFMFNTSAFAQCDSDKYAESCISALKDGYTFLKSYKVDGDGGAKNKVEYSYVFSKDATYMINICSDGPETDGIVVTLYDSNRRMVTTSYANNKYFSAVQYPCNATGIYYITFTFQNSAKHCGGSVLGFKR
jgi:hypothetical protein